MILSVDCGPELGVALFDRTCPTCGRFVKAGEVYMNGLGEIKPGPNATCANCGPVEMFFIGYAE